MDRPSHHTGVGDDRDAPPVAAVAEVKLGIGAGGLEAARGGCPVART